MAAALAPDTALDLDKWGAIYGEVRAFPTAIDLLKTNYLETRCVYLYETHGLNGPADFSVGIPSPQIGNPQLTIGDIEFNSVGGNQDEEYTRIDNPHNFAVDISNWRLTGAVDFTFRPGTVIASNDSLHVSLNVRTFRARASGSSGGQELFVQGGYEPRLPNSGGTVQIVAADGEEVSSQTYAGDQPTIHEVLKISELHYHPADPTAEEIAAGYEDADDVESIELLNTGSETIRLSDARLRRLKVDGRQDGVEFSLLGATISTLVLGARTLVVEDIDAFEFRYGSHLPVVGQWSGGLSNGGETVTLIAGDVTIHQFVYDDGWFAETEGGGFSLEVIDLTIQDQVSLGQMTSWQWSAVLGVPSGSDYSSLHGDFNGDQEINAQDN